MLQFITNEKSAVSPEKQLLDAIDGGCRWVQIRMKNATDDEIKRVFTSIRDRAKETLTTVIINDRVELAKELSEEGVAGVHLGSEDMAPAAARNFLGPNAIIGVTAHSYEDIENVKDLDIDYIGLGPFAHTETKERLAPLLGIDGVKEIVDQAKENEVFIPIVAVGGVKLHDIKQLLEAGVNGVAVSGAIANASNIAEETKKFMDLLPLNE